ncbi:MAG: hypothetical protein WKF37_12090 [Bryobacteraceae bacterium]
MAKIGSIATSQLTGLLRADQGLPSTVANLAMVSEINLAAITEADVLELHLAADLAEKTSTVKYPAIYVYCERVTNGLHEKFKTFAGYADLHIEVRVSHDHVDELQTQLQLYVEAVTDVLDRNRGAWSDGVFYTGGYEIVFQPVKRGGKNFLQTARVQLRTHLSVN